MMSDNYDITKLFNWEETDEEIEERIAFEQSHNFKVGESVLLTTDWIVIRESKDNSYSVFKNAIGVVNRVETSRETGPCIRISVGGLGINIYEPNKELVRESDTLGRLLYGI